MVFDRVDGAPLRCLALTLHKRSVCHLVINCPVFTHFVDKPDFRKCRSGTLTAELAER